jgi:hypothetical protein
MEDHDIRTALDRHWAASDANDFEAGHQIYREDAVLEYPQLGECIRSRRNIQAYRFAPTGVPRPYGTRLGERSVAQRVLISLAPLSKLTVSLFSGELSSADYWLAAGET